MSHEINIQPVQEVASLFLTKHHSCNWKDKETSKYPSQKCIHVSITEMYPRIHHRNVSTYPSQKCIHVSPGNCRGSVGICGPHFRNHCSRLHWEVHPDWGFSTLFPQL